MSFQYIEAALRSCIGVAYRIIRIRTAGVLQFKLDDDSLAKDALGTLVRKFSELIEDHELVENLKRLAPIRNHVAHEALLVSADEPEEVEFLVAEKPRVDEHRKQANECMTRLVDHMHHLSGLLDTEIEKLEQATET